MSGTNHQISKLKLDKDVKAQPRFILVRPQMGENIGASARAMWNFGLERLYLVSPRDGWPNPAAVAMASGAAPVLDQLELRDNLQDATADLNYVFATTARPRDLTKEILSPKEAMKRARAAINSGAKLGFLFGPERAGLENEELVEADALISVPVNPGFASLNLAQCVLLLAYEWRLSEENFSESHMEWAATRAANRQERAHLERSLEEKLDEVGFFWPEEKATSMRLNLRNMFARMPLSDVDIRVFHGIFRALSKKEKFSNMKNKSEEITVTGDKKDKKSKTE